MTTKVLQSGRKWGTNPLAQPDRGGGAPPTPPPRFDSSRRTSSRSAMRLGLPRNVRPHARREEPAHGAVEVPFGARRQGLPRQGRRPLLERLSRGDVHGDDLAGARRPEPAVRRRRASCRASSTRTRWRSSSTARAGSCSPRASSTPPGSAAARWSSLARAPASSSGTGPPGRPTTPTSRSARLTSPHHLAILLDMPKTHVPVLAGELIEALDPQPGQVAVDCTLGAAGHARLVAGRLGPAGPADRDRPRPAGRGDVRRARRRGAAAARGFVRADFVAGLRALLEEGVQADMVYLDLGMSSMQVDTRERGFSYAYDAPLDMRMDPAQPLTAAEIVNTWEPRRLGRLLRDYGEERYADRIAKEIARRRTGGELTTTFELVDAITAAIPAPARFAGGHPGEAHLPGDPHRRQRRARPARRGAPARVGPAARRRPARRDLVPLARGPARQALPRRPHARLHLPARPARLRLRPRRRRPSSCSGAPSRRRRARSPTTRARSPPACGPPASSRRRRCAHDARHRHGRTAGSTAARTPRAPRRVSGPVQRRLVRRPRGPGRAPAPRRRPGSSPASARCPTTASSTGCCARALWIWALGIALLGGS